MKSKIIKALAAWRTLAVIFVAAAAILPAPTPAAAWAVAHSKWGYSGVSYSIHSSVSSQPGWSQAIFDVDAEFDAIGFVMTYSPGSGGNTVMTGASQCGTPGSGGNLASRSINFDNLHLLNTSFTTFINTSCGYQFWAGPNGSYPPANQYDLRTVVRHEFGLVMGASNVLGGVGPMTHQMVPGSTAGIQNDILYPFKWLYTNAGAPVTGGPNTSYFDNSYQGFGAQAGVWDEVFYTWSGFGGDQVWSTIQDTRTDLGRIRRSAQNSTKLRSSFRYYGNNITWMGLSAWDRGTAKVWVDGTYINNYNTNLPAIRYQTERTISVSPLAEHTIMIEHSGGGFVDTDSFIVDLNGANDGKYDDRSPWLRFFGTGWNQGSNSGFYAGTNSWTRTAYDGVKFAYYGTNKTVRWFYTKGPNRGKFTVTMDGYDCGEYDAYAPTVQFGASYSCIAANSGLHTVVIAATGTKNPASSDTIIEIDAFQVS